MAMDTVIEQYLRLEKQPAFVRACKDAVREGDEALLKSRFSKRITFGTAGLRGLMGFGISCMNSATVLQASQGLCKYYLNKLGEEACQKKCVVVGYDGRYHSRYFAHITAAVFMSKKIPVLMCDKLTATPLTPFLVVKHNALCGVQVTASHNPKDDNGYKVYGSNGAQIVPPMDKEVHNLIIEESSEWEGVSELLLHHPHNCLNYKSKNLLLSDPLPSDWQAYKETIIRDLKVKSLADTRVKVVYTAMHGVGYEYIRDFLLCDLKYPTTHFFPVEEQVYPDPEFSTVSFPNPEEAGALDLAVATAKRHGAQILFANDPDADRFVAGELLPNGEYYIFSGDEIGSIFGAIALDKMVAKGVSPKKLLFTCSAVSSKFLAQMAKTEGCRFEETMTGFKWMMAKSLELSESEGLVPAFSYEEALGYGLTMSVPDKDGLSAAAVWLEKCMELYAENKTMFGYLTDLSKKYGFFATNNSYYVCHDPSIMASMFDKFRKSNNGSYPTHIQDFEIDRIRDLAVNYDSASADHKTTFPPTSSDMVTIFFKNGAHITWRGSGTEPKLKYYSEMRDSSSKEQASEKLKQVVKAVCDYLIGDLPLKPAYH